MVRADVSDRGVELGCELWRWVKSGVLLRAGGGKVPGLGNLGAGLSGRPCGWIRMVLFDGLARGTQGCFPQGGIFKLAYWELSVGLRSPHGSCISSRAEPPCRYSTTHGELTFNL